MSTYNENGHLEEIRIRTRRFRAVDRVRTPPVFRCRWYTDRYTAVVQGRMGKRAAGEGTIFRRKSDDRWVGRLGMRVDGKQTIRTVYGESQREVRAKLDALRRQRDAGIGLGADRETIAGFLDEWLATSAGPRLRPKTLISYAAIIRLHLTPELGPIKLVELQPGDVRRLLARKLAEGASARTVRNIRALLRAALATAVRDRRIAINAAALAEPVALRPTDIEPLTADETRALIEKLRSSSWGALFLLSLTAGLRRGEVLGLRWRDVDLEAGRLTVRQQLQTFSAKEAKRLRALPASATPWLVEWVSATSALVALKTAQSARELALLPVVIEALHARSWGADLDGLVFVSSTGSPLVGRNVTRKWGELLEAAGLPSKRLHDARHGAGTLLLEAGVDLKVVQEILGHASISTTANVYVHVRRASTDDATARLGRLLERGATRAFPDAPKAKRRSLRKSRPRPS